MTAPGVTPTSDTFTVWDTSGEVFDKPDCVVAMKVTLYSVFVDVRGRGTENEGDCVVGCTSTVDEPVVTDPLPCVRVHAPVQQKVT